MHERTIEKVYDLKWDDEQHSSFTCMVKFAEFDGDLPFTCVPTDKYEHSKIIWQRGIAGAYGTIKEYQENV